MIADYDDLFFACRRLSPSARSVDSYPQPAATYRRYHLFCVGAGRSPGGETFVGGHGVLSPLLACDTPVVVAVPGLRLRAAMYAGEVPAYSWLVIIRSYGDIVLEGSPA